MNDKKLESIKYLEQVAEPFNLTISSLKEVDYSILTITSPTKNLLQIKRDGSIVAPDLESASEAGRVFVESMRESLLKLLGEIKNA